MNSERIDKPISMPKLFKILIIDDQISSNHECIAKTGYPSYDIQGVITRYLEKLVKVHNSSISVEVKYAKNPDEGVSLWINQIFDLTLVDSDFSKGEPNFTRYNDKEKRSFLDLRLDFAGAYLFCFLRRMLESQDYSKGRKGCEVALWTGLGIDDNINKYKRANRLISILPFDLKCIFIPKKQKDFAEWKKIINSFENTLFYKNVLLTQKIEYINSHINVFSIEQCIHQMRKTNPILNPQKSNVDIKIERIKDLYVNTTPEKFAKLTDISEEVFTGKLVCTDNEVYLGSGELFEEGELLSPLLRRGTDKNLEEAFSKGLAFNWLKDGILKPIKNITEFWTNSCVVAAATPLTGCSAVGKDHAIFLMQQKIDALLNGSFSQVVLKTVYLDSKDQWDNLKWPTLQAQSHHRTRCLRSTTHPRTLWNTGITALESFTPEMMNVFLTQFAEKDVQKTLNTIVSLGSKFPQWNLNDLIKKHNKKCKAQGLKDETSKPYRKKNLVFSKYINEFKNDVEEIWDILFYKIFKSDPKEDNNQNNITLWGENKYPVLEINVRHYLRECIAFHLGGHEYLSPAKIDSDHTKKELDFTGCYRSLDLEFNAWLEILDKIAKKYGKKLLLKLPFRSDLLHFIRLIRDYTVLHEESSIKGITLINAFKSGVVEPERYVTFSPAWYGCLDAWGDAANKKWTYQMSGELLTASRNELLGEVLSLIKNSKLTIHVCGGIMDSQGIGYCSPIIYVDESKCRGCQKNDNCNAMNACPEQAISKNISGKAIIDDSKCKKCGKCIEKCLFSAIKRPNVQIGTWALLDLNLSNTKWLKCDSVPPSIGNGHPTVTNCMKCFKCLVTCQQKAFSTGNPTNAACIDTSKCIECKECISMCPHSAITLGIDKTKLLNNDANDLKEDNKKENDKRINPRLAFCLYELCTACGKCSRTFYCDTFYDRRGLDLPPLMDSRNCTGCGLCAQTCPNGAIQLFKPEHVVVLIAKDDYILRVWHHRLMAYNIPHLVYDASYIEKVYTENEQVISDESSLEDKEANMFENRKLKDLFFDRLAPADYHDERFWSKTKKILKKVPQDSICRKWLFLAWSDPGQVLKDSPVIYAINTEKCFYFDRNSQNYSEEADRGLLLKNVLNRTIMKGIRTEVNKRLNNLREDK